jgi:uncharacterized membrane protein YfhO
VLVGKSSLIYTFERSLGGEFLGYYAYYLASPLSWIVALFPERLIVEAVTFIMILKCGLSGFFFAYYLEKSGRKVDMIGYAMFSTMYALCAYAMAYQSNTMWMDALMLLPLVTLGIERLIKDGNFKFFIIVFSITVWSNYYIGYMCCIYVLLYTICYLCAHRNDEINNLNEKSHTVKSVLRVGIASFIALLIVATILFSAIYSLSFGKNDFQDSKFDFSLRFDFLDLFAKFFLGRLIPVIIAGFIGKKSVISPAIFNIVPVPDIVVPVPLAKNLAVSIGFILDNPLTAFSSASFLTPR